MLMLLATGGFLLTGPQGARPAQRRSVAPQSPCGAGDWAFWVTILTALAVYVESFFDPVTLQRGDPHHRDLGRRRGADQLRGPRAAGAPDWLMTPDEPPARRRGTRKGWTQAELAAGSGSAARPSTPSKTACSRRRRRWPSSSPRRWVSGRAAVLDRALISPTSRIRSPWAIAMSARCMPQPGRNMPSIADLAADAVGALVAGIGVGVDREIAARPVVDAFCRDQAFGMQVGRRRRALARPLDRPARHRQGRAREPIAVELHPIASSRAAPD